MTTTTIPLTPATLAIAIASRMIADLHDDAQCADFARTLADYDNDLHALIDDTLIDMRDNLYNDFAPLFFDTYDDADSRDDELLNAMHECNDFIHSILMNAMTFFNIH